MIYSPKEYTDIDTKVPKAAILAELYTADYPIPPFIVITNDEFITGVPETLSERVAKELPVASYAVRFAAYDEDNQTHSSAGKFHSVIGVPYVELHQAITEVLSKSRPLLNGSLYAVIIQQAIPADVSGVIFSRSPFNSRFIHLERGRGVGSVVSGSSDTETLKFRIGHSDTEKHPAYIAELVRHTTNLEQRFDFPQDIEWCLQGTILYIVQCRPISTFTQAEWCSTKLIDAKCSGGKSVHIKFSEGNETFSHPTPLDFSLLKLLHSTGGAVSAAYKRLGLHYADRDHFILLGNSLYVDIEREQQQLLPSYTLVSPNTYKLRYFPLTELIVTARNSVLLQKPVSKYLIINTIEELRSQLAEPVSTPETISDVFKLILMQYQTIFLINYFIVHGWIQSCIKVESSLVGVIKNLREIPPSDLVPGITHGNSFAIADTSLFTTTVNTLGDTTDELREVVRWQSIRLRNAIEHSLRRILTFQNIDTSLLTYFPIESWQIDKFTVHAAEEARQQYEFLCTVDFPYLISNFEDEEITEEESVILSIGQAHGVLTDVGRIHSHTSPRVLYTKTLSPDIIPHLANASGILCRYGNVLSHAAIVAREMRIPVIKTTINFQDKINKTVTLRAYPSERISILFE